MKRNTQEKTIAVKHENKNLVKKTSKQKEH